MTVSIDAEILTEALRQAPGIIVITDRDMNIIYVNRVEHGHRREDVIGRRHGASLSPEQQRKIEVLFERARATGKPQHLDTFQDAPNGERRWYSTQITSYALGRVGPDEGWQVLKEVSQHTNIKLRNVAELILIWGRSGAMPEEIRAELEDALDRFGPTQIPGEPPEQ